MPRARQRIKAYGEKLALTFQFVETRNEQGKFDLRINTICGVYTNDEVEDLLLQERNEWIYRAREVASRNLAKTRQKALRAKEANDQAGCNEAMKGVSSVLRTFSKSLERGSRQTKRRTGHAEKRKKNADRPTHKAIDDMKAADVSNMYRDARHNSIVVLGKSNRVHAFSNDGKHITSFTIKPDAIDQRKRKERWVALPDAEALALKEAVANQVSGDAPAA